MDNSRFDLKNVELKVFWEPTSNPGAIYQGNPASFKYGKIGELDFGFWKQRRISI
jgi:hypothetical protein